MMLLGVKRTSLGAHTHTHTHTQCLLRETGQLPLYFNWLRCVARFWNSLLTTNNALLSNVNEADLQLNLRTEKEVGHFRSYLLFANYQERIIAIQSSYYFLLQASTMCAFLGHENNKLYFFLHALIVFFEQASSRTS